MVATGISSTVSAGLMVGGLCNVAGNLSVGQNVSISGTLTLNGKPIAPSGATLQNPLSWNVQAFPQQSVFNVPTANAPLFVTRNGLIEVPGLHYLVANNTLTFNNPCIGGETVYGYWTNP